MAAPGEGGFPPRGVGGRNGTKERGGGLDPSEPSDGGESGERGKGNPNAASAGAEGLAELGDGGVAVLGEGGGSFAGDGSVGSRTEDVGVDNAEGVDIGAEADGLAGEGFGARIFGGEAAEGAFLIVEEPRGAEVEEFRLAGGGDENVGGFEVLVDYAMAMDEFDGIEDGVEEAEASGGGEVMAPAVEVEVFAFDEFDDEEGFPGGGNAAVVQLGDVGVGEVGKDLAFFAEAVAGGGGQGSSGEDFDGDAAFKLTVGAVCFIDDAHPAAADDPGCLVGTEARERGFGGAGDVGVVAQEAHDLGADGGEARAGGIQKRMPLFFREFEGRFKEFPNAPELLNRIRWMAHFLI